MILKNFEEIINLLKEKDFGYAIAIKEFLETYKYLINNNNNDNNNNFENLKNLLKLLAESNINVNRFDTFDIKRLVDTFHLHDNKNKNKNKNNENPQKVIINKIKNYILNEIKKIINDPENLDCSFELDYPNNNKSLKNKNIQNLLTESIKRDGYYIYFKENKICIEVILDNKNPDYITVNKIIKNLLKEGVKKHASEGKFKCEETLNYVIPDKQFDKIKERLNKNNVKCDISIKEDKTIIKLDWSDNSIEKSTNDNDEIELPPLEDGIPFETSSI
jgi:hypothetical protein